MSNANTGWSRFAIKRLEMETVVQNVAMTTSSREKKTV